MAWDYKGTQIELDGEYFRAVVDGKRIASSSLAGAKKAIEKHLSLKAQAVTLNLPVIVIRSEWGREETISRATITGVDLDSLRVVASEDLSRASAILPDVEGALEKRDAYLAMQKAYEEARLAYNPLFLNTNLIPRKGKASYAKAVETLLSRYAQAAGKTETEAQ